MCRIEEPDMSADHAPDQSAIRRILIGITGSIAALDVTYSIMWLRHEQGREIRTIMTPQATRMVSPRAVAINAGSPVTLDGEGSPNDTEVPHIALPTWADLFLIYPATADIIGKAANGIADNVLTTCILAATCPVIFVPCMNERMWYKPVVQRNVATLEADGYGVIPPIEVIAVSDGQPTIGGMPQIDVVLEWAEKFVARRAAPQPLNAAAHRLTGTAAVEALAV
jgi:phosphopantothenoylcysteine decarboxylase/phosphopantothenate--cysteine ligase